MLKRLRRGLASLKGVVKQASPKGKWDAMKIAFDFMYCKVKFHVSQDEYIKYRFYNLKNRYRKNFLLVHHKKRYYRNISKRFYTSYKYEFYKRIPDLYSREIILAPYCGEERFVEFLKKHQKVVLKPDKGSWGIGIENFEYIDESSAKEKFKTFSKEAPTICEEYIRQHHSLNQLNPFSVNTIRIVTIMNNGNMEVISATLKTGGAADKFIDNMHNGGIGAQVDIQSGVVTTYGYNYKNEEYLKHPISGEQFLGFKIPNWDKVIELVKKAHHRLPEYIFGWDIAVTEEGADIVEANNSPGPLLMQTMDRIPKGEKIMKMIETIKIPQEYSKSNPYIPDYNSYYN